MIRIKFRKRLTIDNAIGDYYSIYIVPTIKLGITRLFNGYKPDKIANIDIALVWLKWDLYMNLSL